MLIGLESLVAQNFAPLKGRRVALLTNPSAVDRNLTSAYDHFRKTDVCQLVALFGAEHGLWAVIPDGIPVTSVHDALTGLPVYSLYGDAYRPTPEMLKDVDILVCDIQDVGVRYYTFIWTMTHILEACGEYNIPLMVLDRPNPLGDTIRGFKLETSLVSLVGRAPIPIQHGLTIGEFCMMFNAVWNPHPADVSVIPCEVFSRHRSWQSWQRPFVPPSPNMPHLSTVQQYPGACLIEGTNLSEGRGTPLPFEVVGAPFINHQTLASALNDADLSGVRFRPHIFTPTASKHAQVPCKGVQVHITDNHTYDPLLVWLTVIQIILQQYPDEFSWQALGETNTGHHFDRLIGQRIIRHQLETNISPQNIIDDHQTFLTQFRAQRRPYLIYSEVPS